MKKVFSWLIGMGMLVTCFAQVLACSITSTEWWLWLTIYFMLVIITCEWDNEINLVKKDFIHEDGSEVSISHIKSLETTNNEYLESSMEILKKLGFKERSSR